MWPALRSRLVQSCTRLLWIRSSGANLKKKETKLNPPEDDKQFILLETSYDVQQQMLIDFFTTCYDFWFGQADLTFANQS